MANGKPMMTISAEEARRRRARGESRTDRERVRGLSEAELERAISTDPDWAGGSLYVPLMGAGGPHLAVRAGGDFATGAYPVQFAAALGGRRSLRGYQSRRFSGDAAMHTGAELRVPVGTINMFVRSQLGVFGLVDAGRVRFDGRSDGGWHSGVGGGVWLAAFGQAVSVAYARGESNRLYIRTGLSY